MTSTRRWLEERRERLVRLELGSGLLITAGAVLALFAVGVGLARAGTYLRAPWMLLLMWLAPMGAVAAGAWWYRRRARQFGARGLASEIEVEGRLRRGSLSGVAGEDPVRGSGSLAALADRRAAQWLSEHGDGALAPARGRGARLLRLAVAVLIVGAVLLSVTEPTSGRAAAFWSPVATLARARGPIQVSVDRDEVKRGERVTVTVHANGRAGATLWIRAPGEPWQSIELTLDSTGAATHVLGPLESDQFVRASAAGRTSETLRVRVALPSFLAELQIVARYPEYLGLADEPLIPGPDTVLVPAGTKIATTGRATVPIRSAGWTHSGRTTGLVVNGQEFSGEALVDGTSVWKLLVVPTGGGGLEDLAPELHLMAVRDSAPSVSVPVPGADTTAPATLKQPLVIDVRDDNKVSRVELITRRVSHAGVSGGRSTEIIPVPDEGAERLVLQWLLDLNGQGFVPGDTAYFRVRAYDNAPTPQVAETREYILRLPTLADMREAVREASRELKAAMDSILKEQTALAEETQDVAEQRQREQEAAKAAGEQPKDLSFREAEKAQDLTKRQQEVLDRAEEMKEELRELSGAAKAAGLNDPQFQQQIKDLQRLMDQAMTPEMREQMAKMREALQKLDAKGSRDQMQKMSESAREMQEQMERSKEMLERAAIEGSMTTLASDADDLAARQRDWNEATKRGLDSNSAKAEKKLANEADSLAARLDALKQMIDQTKDKTNELQDSVRANDSLKTGGQQGKQQDGEQQGQQAPKTGDQKGPAPTEAQQAKKAAQDMKEAADAAQKKDVNKAKAQGEEASDKMDPLAQQLRKSRDEMQSAWKQEVLGKMDAALAETSELAKQQQELAERMQKGDGSPDVRGQQAALKEGMDKIVERLQSAAGKNALVSNEISTAMGYARQQMKQALEMLQQPVPNTRSAATIAGQAVTGLTSVAYSMLTAREDVQGSGSGSGFSEAVQKLANMAGNQSALAGKSGQLLPQMQQGNNGEAREQVKRAGAQQRRIADDLDRLDAQGQTPSGVEQLAEEARALAREMEGGQLNQRTLERQDKLYRRLLDAGRTLSGEEEEDEKQERKSETAKDGNVLVPPKLKPGAVGAAPRFPYPTWEDLRQLSPEERRLILDYFRRLNDSR